MEISEGLTVVVAREEIFFIIGMPREHFDKISDERWDLTFQQDAVPHYNVFLVDICVVMLGYH